MRFLLDESVDARLAYYLANLGHDATRVASNYPAGLRDEEVLSLAYTEGRILITSDRDFGELVFRHRQPHTGVIYLRIPNYAPLATKTERLAYVLTHYRDQLDQFLVVTKTRVRVRQGK